MTTKALPRTSEEFAEYLGDFENVAKDLENGTFKDVIENRIKAERDDTMKQVQEQVQMVKAEIGVAPGTPVNLGPKERGRGAVFNNSASLGHGLNGEVQDFAELAQIATSPYKNYKNGANLKAKLDRLNEYTNSFGSEVPDAGGFLVPEEFRSDLVQLSLESAVVRPRSTVIPMSTLRTLIPTVDDTSHVTNVFGGIQGYWTEEAASLNESQASFARVALDAKKLTLFCNIPNELMADAAALNGWLAIQLPKALAWFEDVAFFSGTGTGEPQGFLNSPSMITVSGQAGQTTKTVVWENIVGMYSRMLPQALANAAWLVAPDVFPQLATMGLSVGTGGGPVWIGSGYNPGNSGATTPPATMLGLPIVISEKVPALGTAGCVSLVDFSYYLIGDRQAMTVDSSIHYKFQNDMTSVRVIERVDGRPWLQSALTPHNNSTNTLSPFVQLAAI